ncbi:MAG: DEAD/DEAH box helicase [Candidatus Izemoplasma sp.]
MNIKKEYISEAIKDLGFKKFTQIQDLVIPKALNKSDIIGCSQTGSGKTHAFLIPIFENLKEDVKEVQAVISAPTRELAVQIFKNAKQLASFSDTPIDIRHYVGGSDRDKEVARLKKGQPQIVIGTPGKIKDLAITQNVLNIYKANIFVIDEADMSLDSGFLEDIDAIAGLMNEDLQMMVFSATIPERLRPFLRKYMSSPIEIFIKPKELSSLNINHTFMNVKSKQPLDMLYDLTKVINPYIALIFCNRKETVEEVGSFLIGRGVKVAKLHGDMAPRARRQIMNKINNAEFQYIVASDIASRGIDIDGVSHVINYELPKDMEFYIHRTGRTGRASYTGEAISLYKQSDARYIDFLESKGIKITYKDIKNDTLVVRRERNERLKRKNVGFGFDKNKVDIHRKNKKVKPGYKKVYHRELQQAKQRAIRVTNKKG